MTTDTEALRAQFEAWEPCVDCEIVGLHEQHRNAARTIARVRDRLRELGAPKASA